jgi:hypothetical protein
MYDQSIDEAFDVVPGLTRDPYSAANLEDTAYGSLLSQGRPRVRCLETRP